MFPWIHERIREILGEFYSPWSPWIKGGEEDQFRRGSNLSIYSSSSGSRPNSTQLLNIPHQEHLQDSKIHLLHRGGGEDKGGRHCPCRCRAPVSIFIAVVDITDSIIASFFLLMTCKGGGRIIARVGVCCVRSNDGGIDEFLIRSAVCCGLGICQA